MFSRSVFSRSSRLVSSSMRNSMMRASLSATSGGPPTLSAESIKIVKSTAPIIAEKGYEICRTMYSKMLKNPEMREMFNPTHQVQLPGEKYAHQPKSLADSIYAYAANIDNLGVLGEAVERIAQKHVSVHVLPQHYPVVKENLFWAFGQVLGDAVTPAVANAWSEAYDLLAYIFIEREKQIRESKKNLPGGWEGYKPFVVTQKTVENPEVTSFVLKPADGGPVIPFEPGSYVGVQITTPEGKTVRNYSLSAPYLGDDTKSYRISVKKVPPISADSPKGVVSNVLHDHVNVGDTVDVGVPCGDFVMQVKDQKPIVLISGGVGITPTISMFEHLMANKVHNKITMISAFRDPKVAILQDEIQRYARGKENVKVVQLFDKPGQAPQPAELMKSIEDSIDNKDAHYYFCGPSPFMQTVQNGLKGWSIPRNQVHFEFFGPTEQV